MDKIAKALAKLSAKEREKVKIVLAKLAGNKLSGLDIKHLKGRSDIFRVRLGDIRIIYRQNSKGEILILAIARTNEKTYKL